LLLLIGWLQSSCNPEECVMALSCLGATCKQLRADVDASDAVWRALTAQCYPVPSSRDGTKCQPTRQALRRRLAGWRRHAATFELPSLKQMVQCVVRSASAHSYYKHLNISRTAPFSFHLSHTACMRAMHRGKGRDAVREWVAYVRGDGTEFHYTWTPTAEYTERYGQLVHVDGCSSTVDVKSGVFERQPPAAPLRLVVLEPPPPPAEPEEEEAPADAPAAQSWKEFSVTPTRGGGVKIAVDATADWRHGRLGGGARGGGAEARAVPSSSYRAEVGAVEMPAFICEAGVALCSAVVYPRELSIFAKAYELHCERGRAALAGVVREGDVCDAPLQRRHLESAIELPPTVLGFFEVLEASDAPLREAVREVAALWENVRDAFGRGVVGEWSAQSLAGLVGPLLRGHSLQWRLTPKPAAGSGRKALLALIQVR